MKKIGLLLTTHPHRGGVFQYNQSILDALLELPEEEYQVKIVYTSPLWRQYLDNSGGDSLFIDVGLCERLMIFTLHGLLPLPLARWLIGKISSLGRNLLEEKCDLWIFPSEDKWGYLLPVRSLTSIHDLMHRYERRFPEVSSNMQFKMREFLYRSICNWSDGILVDSEVGRNQMVESYGVKPSNVYVLPYIAPKYVRVGNYTPEGFNERYALPDKYIFYPAQFWKHKNHSNLVSAVASLKNMLPDLKLVLAGSQKNAYTEVVDLVRQKHLQDDVLFLGYVPDDDMAELYARARALIMPTFFGPTNIPPLEAFATGCPVAVSGIYGMTEQMGDAALLFDPESVQGIAESIHKLWIDDALCDELARRGRKRSAEWGAVQFADRVRLIIEKTLGLS